MPHRLPTLEAALRRSGLVIGLLLATVVSASAQTMTATWDRNTDPYTAGYRLYYGTSPGTYTTNVDVGTATSRQITLTAGATYYFVVRAYNSASQLGPPSSEVSIALAPPPPPTAQLTATLGPGSVAQVSWQTTNATSATLNGASVTLSGSAQFPIAATTTYTLIAAGPSGRVTATRTVVVPRVDCVVSAWAFQSATPWGQCAGGMQSRTETWTRSILTPPSGGGAACGALEDQRVLSRPCTDPTPTAPGAPAGIRSRVAGSSVSLGWSLPLTGGAPTGYRLWAGITPGGSELADGRDMGNVLQAGGTLPRGTYYVRVAAYNAVGQGPETPEVSFRVGARARPGRPRGFAAALQQNVVTLSWLAPAGDDADSPTGYVIEAGSSPGRSDLATVMVGAVSTFEAPVAPGTYFVRVRAINELGPGDVSDEVVLRYGSGPGAPANLVDTGTGALVALAWQAPTTGEVPAGYLIEAGSASGRADLAVLRVGNVTAFTTTAPPGTYYVRVRGVTADGRAGDASNEIMVRR